MTRAANLSVTLSAVSSGYHNAVNPNLIVCFLDGWPRGLLARLMSADHRACVRAAAALNMLLIRLCLPAISVSSGTAAVNVDGMTLHR